MKEAEKATKAAQSEGAFAEEVTEEEAAKIEAEEKAKKEGKKVVEEEKKGDGSDKEDGESKGRKPNSGNGGVTDKYDWTQTLAEATMNVFLPDNTKAKDLLVIIKQKSLKVALKATPD